MNILRLRDPAQWPVEKWDIHSVIAKRRALFYTETVWSPEIWKYNKSLLTQRQEKLTIDELIEIWSHAIYCVYLTYSDPKCDLELRHQMLLNLKEDFNKYLTLPERIQEKFWPMWSIWYGKFVEEELVEEGWWDGATA
jgi:hypothetical protein